MPYENAVIAEAEQVVRDHRDRLKAVMLMEVRLFKWDFELLDNEPPEIVAMVARTARRPPLDLVSCRNCVYGGGCGIMSHVGCSAVGPA